jgi:hypothetical protein
MVKGLAVWVVFQFGTVFISRLRVGATAYFALKGLKEANNFAK